MNDNPKRKAVTVGFNILLFLYLIYVSFVSYFFDPKSESRVPLDVFIDIAPATSIVVAVVLVVILFLLAALVIRAFWNRLITSLFSIRDINYQEALAIILMISIVFGA
jgi:hypothetical protein